MAKKPNEIQITRVYDAPVKLVWDAWVDEKQVGKWWGPRGFTITTKSKELRPGGKWIYTMHGPDGTDWPNITTYHEVVKHEKLVYDHGGNEDRPKLFTVNVTFNENKGKTTMTMTMAFDSVEEAIQSKKFIKQASGNSTWDRLGEYLENQTAGTDPFIINRTFEADIKTVFEMWVNPEHYVRWMGPTGANMKLLSTNVKEGGTSLWSMTIGDSTKYGQLHYKKIQPTDLFVYAQNFSDEKGNLIKFPIVQTYPDRVLTTVTFASESENETRVTVRWDILGEANEVERKTFHDMKSGMTVGWNQSFDKIDEILEKKQ